MDSPTLPMRANAVFAGPKSTSNRTLTSSAKVKNALAEYFESESDWRSRKAEQYPHDTRNHRSSEALKKLASTVRAMSDSDPALQPFLGLPEAFGPDGDVFESPFSEHREPASKSMVSRYGFECEENERAFLEAFAQQVLEDYKSA